MSLKETHVQELRMDLLAVDDWFTHGGWICVGH